MVVVRGLDRIDGTHVDSTMDDTLWAEHTAEIRARFEASFVDGAPPVAFNEFCEDYATGRLTTAAQRKAVERISQAARDRASSYEKRSDY
mmetsp:Transcript_23471/g.70361  ORF Transcript_23471/g.70361 Transcript_23471/m.70361 type:complete len:90 (-) Transcript_23471:51-320(-)|eukprot:CAMPEP_0119272686 /NCGR_PEP_ID=MMETSP1329-20130426/8926_1 /TAXON_ID=114041 /ORGANISM="Genus nov. species nov., Strain RCC1024" /LENGTH=89 /DNA_ID=CAMNT_0007272773 /DNA_START=389 /DNA_END=658 /DNA_ORIENTATION=+